MADLVSLSDYVGDFQFQQDNGTTSKFNSIRDEWDRVYIRRLLGAELGNLFLADFDANTPTTLTARFQTIYDAIQEDDNSRVIESKGIKFFVKGIVWYYFARQNNVLVSIGGNKSKRSENSEPANQSFFYAKNYNAAIRTGRAIQWYIEKNSSTYPEYNGQSLTFLV